MSRIDEEVCNAVIEKVSEGHMHLSDRARKFIINELDEDDIIDYQQAITYYQHIIKDRFYMELEDEQDFSIIEIMKVLINCYLEHIDDI
jgi:regulator of sigma D